MLIVGFLVGATALSAVASWSGPSVPGPGESLPCTPPKCNVDAPVNTGSNPQGKMGGLSLGSSSPTGSLKLDVNGAGLFDSLGVISALSISTGAYNTPGSVLANMKGDGFATWVSTSSLGMTGGTFTPNSNLLSLQAVYKNGNIPASFTIPAGATRAVVTMYATWGTSSGWSSQDGRNDYIEQMKAFVNLSGKKYSGMFMVEAGGGDRGTTNYVWNNVSLGTAISAVNLTGDASAGWNGGPAYPTISVNSGNMTISISDASRLYEYSYTVEFY